MWKTHRVLWSVLCTSNQKINTINWLHGLYIQSFKTEPPCLSKCINNIHDCIKEVLKRKKRLRILFTLSQKRGVLSYTHNKMVGCPPYVLWWWFLFIWQLLLIIFFSFQVAKGIKIRLYTPQLCAGQLHKVEASLHCPNTAAPHPQVSFPYGNCEQKCQKNLL